MNPCILIPILVGLISALLGYLLGRLNNNANVQAIGNTSLQSDLEDCRKHSASLNAKISDLELQLSKAKQQSVQSFASNQSASSFETLIPFDSELAKSIFGKTIKQNDLKIVEGIGPKIEELYHEAGIKTWKELSETALEKSEKILNSGGERFAIHNPSTWAKQALLAYEGKWKELKDWQDSLDGGKE